MATQPCFDLCISIYGNNKIYTLDQDIAFQAAIVGEPVRIVNVRTTFKGARGYLKVYETLHQGDDDDVWVELPSRRGRFEHAKHFKKCNVALVEAPPQRFFVDLAPKPAAEDSAAAAMGPMEVPLPAAAASASGSMEWSPQTYPDALMKVLFDESLEEESSVVDESLGGLRDSYSRTTWQDCDSMMVTDIVWNNPRGADAYESMMNQTFKTDPLP
jgi:hypothetical protein